MNVNIASQDTVYSMTENTQFPGFIFMFPQVVQKH